jgi:hypothetical protein
MTKSIVLTIPHQLGREKACARAREGMEQLRRRYLDKVARAEVVWAGDVANVTVEALGQTALATIAIFDDHARIDLRLPGLLGMLSGKIQTLAQRNAEEVLRIEHSRENN